MKTERQKEGKRRFNGELELTHYTREREREREREYTENSIFKKGSNSMYMSVFNEHLLYKS